MKLAIRVQTAFGLAFDIEKSSERNSGFRPAQVDLSSRNCLFGDLRLEGFAALLSIGFADKLIIVGGVEARYPHESVSRAWAIRRMLIEDMGVQQRNVDAIHSASSTGGNIAAIRASLGEDNFEADKCAVVSNHYHLPRIQYDLRANGLKVSSYPAEAFCLLASGSPAERAARKDRLIARFGDGPLAKRVVEEVNGIADKLTDSYRDKSS